MKQQLCVICLVLSIAIRVSAQPAADTLAQHYYRLATSRAPEDKALLSGILYQSIQGHSEKDWLLACQLFSVMKKKGVADSIEAVIGKKFPGGEYWRGKDVEKVYAAEGSKAKEAAYSAWVYQYPPAKFAGSRILYDYASNDVARTFAKEKQLQKALLYADKVQTPAWRGEGWAGVAIDLEKNGFIKEATLLYKKALDNAYAFKTYRTKEEGAGFAASGYRGYCNYYAGGLLQEKKYDSALVYIEKAYALYKEPDASVNLNYATILAALGKDKEAYEKADEIVKLGLGNEALKSLHRKLYTNMNAGGKDYDAYMAEMQEAATTRVIANLQNTMIDQPGQAFELKDVDGNRVSSAQLKGKIVILDFWATWCGPCKKSFPAMQMAVNQYKNDTNVLFLFIHTWEKEDGDATAAAKKYMNDNQYTFRVLMDLKEETSGSNKLVEAYGIKGIPTKLILDKNGRVRFSITGFSGEKEAAVKELSAMIALVKKATS